MTGFWLPVSYRSRRVNSSHSPRCLGAQTRNQPFRIIDSERGNSNGLARLSETTSLSTERAVLSGTLGKSNAGPGDRGKDRRLKGRDSKGSAIARLGRFCYLPARLQRWVSASNQRRSDHDRPGHGVLL